MPHRNQKCFDEGWKAWTDGAQFEENPYLLHLGLFAESMPDLPAGAWGDGWRAAQEDHEHQEATWSEDYSSDRGDWEFHRDHDQ